MLHKTWVFAGRCVEKLVGDRTDKYYNNIRIKVIIKQKNIMYLNPFKDEAQTALFKDPVRTAQ